MPAAFFPRCTNQLRLCCEADVINFLNGASLRHSNLRYTFARNLIRTLFVTHTRHQLKPQARVTLNIFDRNAKKLQRERAASLENAEVYDYIKEEIGFRLADRIFDVKRKFNRVLDLGCSRGYVSKHVVADNVEHLILSDSSDILMSNAICEDSAVKIEKVVCDEEHLISKFEPNSLDLVVSNLVLHWVNDLPSCFAQVMKILKNDSAFIGAVFGSDTLFELRSSLQLAELERRGGIAPHISPFVRPRDIGGLLTGSGFVMQTIDADELIVSYPTMFELMSDLKGMGESNAAWNRALHVSRDTLLAATVIYEQLYGAEKDGVKGIPATFQILYFIGWKPDPSQPQPLQRGSAEVSLKDLYKLGDVVGEPVKIEIDEDKDR